MDHVKTPSLSCLDRRVAVCRWESSHLPEVEFRNGRKEVIFPERFTADIPATGTCSRTQARLQRPAIGLRDRPTPHTLLLAPSHRFPASQPIRVSIKILAPNQWASRTYPRWPHVLVSNAVSSRRWTCSSAEFF